MSKKIDVYNAVFTNVKKFLDVEIVVFYEQRNLNLKYLIF
jgi:hypothetical protein